MGNIEKFLSNNSYAPRIDRQPFLPDGDNNLYKEKLVFSPSELKLGGKRPTRITLTENQVETKLFEKYGFNVKNKVQFEMLKLRFDTKNSPFSEINWEKGSFVAQLNSAGQYEITLALRESTLEALSGRLISAPAPNNNPQNPDPNKTTASLIGINSADYRRFQIENKLQPNLTDLTPEQQALVMDLTQIGLSVVGIFDPTGLADGADAMISLGRGDYWGAGISALGIIPYIGDLAKVGKLPKLLKTVENIVTMAKTDARFAKIVEPLLKGLKNSLDSLPINKLPNWAKEPLEKLKTKIDEFFAISVKKGDDVPTKVDTLPTKVDGTTTPKQPDIEPPKKTQNDVSNSAPLKTQEIVAPSTGKVIKIYSDENSIIPVDKVEKYIRGKVDVDIQAVKKEIRELNEFKNTQRKVFDQNPENVQRLEALKKMQHNFERSDAMRKTLESIGLVDTPQNNKIIVEHLFKVGRQITSANRVDFPSVLQGPAGKLKVLSTWSIVDNKPYLSTIKLIPMR